MEIKYRSITRRNGNFCQMYEKFKYRGKNFALFVRNRLDPFGAPFFQIYGCNFHTNEPLKIFSRKIGPRIFVKIFREKSGVRFFAKKNLTAHLYESYNQKNRKMALQRGPGGFAQKVKNFWQMYENSKYGKWK